MNETSQNTFRSTALASRLLTEEQLDNAIALIGAEVPHSPAKLVDVPDQRLADKLVALGRVNRWQADQLLAGRTKFNLGSYQIIDSIGQGGMGQVFKAEHMLMGRVVAVKVLPRSKSTPDSIAGFAHEIRAQAQLDHPNLVRAYDAGHDGNVYYLVREYVPGTDLYQLVTSRGRLSQREASTIISQVARGLEHAHQRGLIHRDCKPGNVLVTPDGHAKVSDLGLVGYLNEEDAEADPRAGRIVGTADYLSPELIVSPRKFTPASDIYSLGCTLYYAVTGKVPFPGGTTREKCYRHCHETPLHPRRFNPELTDDFLDVLADMMEKDPARRVPTAVDVIRRLAPWTDEAIAPLPPSTEAPRWRAPPSLRDAVQRNEPGNSSSDFPEFSQERRDAPSQISQGTTPLATASEETAPNIERQPQAGDPLESLPQRPLLPIVLPIGLVLLSAAIALFFFLIRR